MLAAALVACLAPLSLPPAQILQDTGTVDAPVYENAAYGVSVPRPFADWVFEPGQGHRTVTVIFHPRGVPLAGQVWGALLLTPYPGSVPLGQVADQRIQVAWRPQLGSTFTLLGRDSLWIAGWPAIHLSMSGTVGPVALRADEYVIARRRDLIVLQFRYPRTLPEDSLAAGYRRVVDGLSLGGVGAAGRARAPVAAGERRATARLLRWSPWQARAFDALVRIDTTHLEANIAVRMELVNDGPVPAESATVWLDPVFALDSVAGASPRLPARILGSAVALRLPAPVEPQGSATINLFFRLGPEAVALPRAQASLAPDRAYFAWDWLPRVQPALDSAGRPARTLRPRLTLRFDVPGAWRAVAPGRLTAEASSLGRRFLTWTSEEVGTAAPAFAVGPYRVVQRWDAGLGVALWLGPDDALSGDALAAMIGTVRAAWIFCSRAFGFLPLSEVNVVSTRLPATRGFAGLVLAGGLDTSRDVLLREVARTWWGNSVNAAGPGSPWILEGFPSWAAIAARGVLEGDTVRQRLVREAEARWRAGGEAGDRPLAAIVPDGPGTELLESKGAAALEAARRAAGEPAFREAILSLALEHRNGWIALDDVLAALGADARAVLRPFLY